MCLLAAACPTGMFLTTQTTHELVVDTSRGAHIDINVSILLSATASEPDTLFCVCGCHVVSLQLLLQGGQRLCQYMVPQDTAEGRLFILFAP